MAWGRQSRDYVRQLDEFDTTQEMATRMQLPWIDLYDEDSPSEGTLLQQVHLGCWSRPLRVRQCERAVCRSSWTGKIVG